MSLAIPRDIGTIMKDEFPRPRLRCARVDERMSLAFDPGQVKCLAPDVAMCFGGRAPSSGKAMILGA